MEEGGGGELGDWMDIIRIFFQKIYMALIRAVFSRILHRILRILLSYFFQSSIVAQVPIGADYSSP